MQQVFLIKGFEGLWEPRRQSLCLNCGEVCEDRPPEVPCARLRHADQRFVLEEKTPVGRAGGSDKHLAFGHLPGTLLLQEGASRERPPRQTLRRSGLNPKTWEEHQCKTPAAAEWSAEAEGGPAA